MAVISELRARKRGRIWIPNRWALHVELGRNITAPSLGEWLDIEGMHPFTVALSGDFVGVAHLLVSNQQGDERPDDALTDEPQVGPDVLGAQVIYQDAPYRWMKLWVETVDSGSIRRAVFFGVERPGS